LFSWLTSFSYRIQIQSYLKDCEQDTSHFKELQALKNAVSDELIKMTVKLTNGTKFLSFQS